MEHFCHEHPLGGERSRYWCGHYCDEPPCPPITIIYRIRRFLGVI